MSQKQKIQDKEQDRFLPAAEYVAKDMKGTTGVIPPVYQFVSNADGVEEQALEQEESTVEEKDWTSSDMPPADDNRSKNKLPSSLQASMEQMSGLSLDDVKVHYNSSKPAQLQAHAYAQGTDIHLASGQEKHLPHEAWHVVQQKQGRVQPTAQLKGKGAINDNAALEREADKMGAKAANESVSSEDTLVQTKKITGSPVAQLKYKYDDTWQPGMSWGGMWTQEQIDAEKKKLDDGIDQLYKEAMQLAGHNYIQHLTEFPREAPKSKKSKKQQKGQGSSDNSKTQKYDKYSFDAFKGSLEKLLMEIEERNVEKVKRERVASIAQKEDKPSDYIVTWKNREPEMEWIQTKKQELFDLNEEIKHYKPAAAHQSSEENSYIDAQKAYLNQADPDKYLPKKSKQTTTQNAFKLVRDENIRSSVDNLLGMDSIIDYQQRSREVLKNYEAQKEAKDREELEEQQRAAARLLADQEAQRKRQQAEQDNQQAWTQVLHDRQQLFQQILAANTGAGIDVQQALDRFFDGIPTANEQRLKSADDFRRRLGNQYQLWPAELNRLLQQRQDNLDNQRKQAENQQLITDFTQHRLHEAKARAVITTARAGGAEKEAIRALLTEALRIQKNPSAHRWRDYLGLNAYSVIQLPDQIQGYGVHITYDADSISGTSDLSGNVTAIRNRLLNSPAQTEQLHITLECNHLPDEREGKEHNFLNPKVYFGGGIARYSRANGSEQDRCPPGFDWGAAENALNQALEAWLVANVDNLIADAKAQEGNVDRLRPPV